MTYEDEERMTLFRRAPWGPVEFKGRINEVSVRVPGSSWVTVNNRMGPSASKGMIYLTEELMQGIPILIDDERVGLAKQYRNRDLQLFVRGGRIWFEGDDQDLFPQGLVFKGHWNGDASLRIGRKRVVRPFRVLGFINTILVRHPPFRPKIAPDASPNHVALYFACRALLIDEV